MKFGKETGKTVEWDLFGAVENSIEYREWLKMKSKPIERAAIRIVKENQPKDTDPEDPKPKFPNDLQFAVFNALENDNVRVRFYTAVGSSFDYHRDYGGDGFIEIEENGGEPIMITLDVKTHEEDTKSNVLIVYPAEGLDPEDLEDKIKWDELIAKTTRDVIMTFKIKKVTKQKQAERRTAYAA